MTDEIRIPTDVAAFHDNTFGNIGRYIAKHGDVEDTHRVTYVEVQLRAGEGVVVTDYETEQAYVHNDDGELVEVDGA